MYLYFVFKNQGGIFLKYSFSEKDGYKIWSFKKGELSGKSPVESFVATAALAIADGNMERYEKLMSGTSCDMSNLLGTIEFSDSAERAAALIKGGNLGRVLVYGDYDADGVCATAIAMKICEGRGSSVSFFVPHRYNQGYGLHKSVVDSKKDSFDTLIVVDCGTQNFDMLEELSKSGKNVVVFDHHEQGAALVHPAVVNPKSSGTLLRGSEMCAAGLIWAWATRYGVLDDNDSRNTSWLAAIATVADCMPLTELNRCIVSGGLDVMSRTPAPQIQRLMEKNNIGQLVCSDRLYSVCARDIAMRIAPCINAAGRIEHADIAVRAMLGKPGFESAVDRLIELNEQRKAISKQIVAEATERFYDSSGVLKGDWAVGVTSGAAGALCSSHQRPVALAVDMGEGRMHGTVRAPDGGDILTSLANISSLLTSWGGHKQAAGFSCKVENWESIAEKLRKEFASMKIESPLKPAIKIPADCLSIEAWQEVESRFGPFGQGNPAPALYIVNPETACAVPLGKTGEHSKIDLGMVTIVAFGYPDQESLSMAGGWLCEPNVNCWRGMENLQLMVSQVVDREPMLDISMTREEYERKLEEEF